MSEKRLVDCARAYPNESWDRQALSQNSGISLDTVIALNVNDTDWDWTELSRNVPIQDIKSHPEYPWDWSAVSSRWNVDIDMIVQNGNKNWNWTVLCAMGCWDLTLGDVLANPSLPWDYDMLTARLPADQLFGDQIISWDWYWLRYNMSVTFRHVIDHPEVAWDFSVLSCLPAPPDDAFQARPKTTNPNALCNEGVLRALKLKACQT